jgi:Domain of unknown function (DUF4159)
LKPSASWRRFLVFGGPALLWMFVAAAQGWFGGGGENEEIGEDVKTARDVPSHSTGTPNWTNAPGFEWDTFTFVRIRRDQNPYTRGGPWQTDTPDSDLNLSYRLQQMTSMKVDPNGRYLRLTDPDLQNYPFIYMVEPGSLILREEEVEPLRKYLLNGGFLMVDDFWGEAEWANMAGQMKRVFPNRQFVELPLDHPLYHCVFEINAKGQVPNIMLGIRSEHDPEHRTWERPDAKVVHHRVIYDDRGRVMVMATHNTDNGDGWEREGESDFFFHNFSEKISYPLGINIIFYTMTH